MLKIQRTGATSMAARFAGGASALALTIAFSATAANAQAPAAAAPDANVVSEVTVTAEFRTTNVQATPIAITAVNAATLEARSQTSIQDVANQAPNVTLKPLGAAFGPALGASIRGIGQYDFSFALEPGVGMYVDDVYYSTLTGSIFDLLDLDRVEILRGPQGTLAGKNSIGGAIKLYSKKPNGQGGGYVEATGGSFSRIDVRASADFTVVPDKLFARISGVSKHRDGYVDRVDYACTHPGSGIGSFATGNGCKLGTEGGQSYSAVRGLLRWVVSDKVEVNLIADATKDSSEVQASTNLLSNNNNAALTARNGNQRLDCRFVPYGPDSCDPAKPNNPYLSYSTFTDVTNPAGRFAIPAINTFTGYGVSGTVDWQLADSLKLTSISAFRYYKGDFAEDTDGSPLDVELVMNHVEHQQFSEEMRLSGNFGSQFEYTVGGFYFTQRNKNSNRVDLPYAGLDFRSADPVPSTTKAGFANGVWHVSSKLNVSGGARYTTERKDYSYIRINPNNNAPAPVVGPLTGTTGQFSGHRFDYRVAADYHFTDDLMAYVSTATGFKGGGINPRPFVTTQVQPFGPEKLTAYEIGLKNTMFDRRLRVNVAAFYNKYKDIQLTLLSCPQFSPPIPGFPCALPQNAGDATVKGLEGEFEFHPAAGLTIDGSASYLDFSYDRINPLAGGPTAPAGVQLSMTPPFTPKWKWSLGAQYEFGMNKWGTLTPRLDASFQDTVFSGAVNSANNTINSYTLVNFRATWRASSGDWEAAVAVTNLTDKLYYATKFDLSGLAGYVNAQPGRPREFAVTLKRRF